MNTLFDMPPIEQRTEKCKTCVHAQRWELNPYCNKVFWYCSAIKSNRTNNGLLKIKANQIACEKYKNVE